MRPFIACVMVLLIGFFLTVIIAGKIDHGVAAKPDPGWHLFRQRQPPVPLKDK